MIYRAEKRKRMNIRCSPESDLESSADLSTLASPIGKGKTAVGSTQSSELFVVSVVNEDKSAFSTRIVTFGLVESSFDVAVSRGCPDHIQSEMRQEEDDAGTGDAGVTGAFLVWKKSSEITVNVIGSSNFSETSCSLSVVDLGLRIPLCETSWSRLGDRGGVGISSNFFQMSSLGVELT